MAFVLLNEQNLYEEYIFHAGSFKFFINFGNLKNEIKTLKYILHLQD